MTRRAKRTTKRNGKKNVGEMRYEIEEVKRKRKQIQPSDHHYHYHQQRLRQSVAVWAGSQPAVSRTEEKV